MTLCTPPCLHQQECAFYGCPFSQEERDQFGCVNTGSNLHPLQGQSANSNSGPSSHDWIAGSGDTAAINSRVAA